MTNNDDDFLGKFANNAKKEIGEQEAIKRKEPNKTVAMKQSDYEALRKYAFDNRKKMVDVLHEIVQAGLKSKIND